jgi:hypothetical protein
MPPTKTALRNLPQSRVDFIFFIAFLAEAPTKLAFAFLLPAFAGELSSLSQPLCGVSDFSKDQTAI